MENLDRRTAERSVDLHDEARLGYARRMYDSEREDWADYHMIIDSTAIDLDTVVNIIVDASTARRRQAALSAQQ
jgi:cytidylate kinase